jgi:hypothetical protein
MDDRENTIRAPLHPPPRETSAAAELLDSFSTSTMEGTTFNDLWVSLGIDEPGLYSHQGGCEHLLVINDVRRFDPVVDPPLQKEYPFLVSATAFKQHRSCEVCCARGATKVTYDDRSAPHSPSLWCDGCFNLAHYDDAGHVKYTDFRVFPYSGEYQTVVGQMAKKEKKKRRRPGGGGGVDTAS